MRSLTSKPKVSFSICRANPNAAGPNLGASRPPGAHHVMACLPQRAVTAEKIPFLIPQTWIGLGKKVLRRTRQFNPNTAPLSVSDESIHGENRGIFFPWE